MTLTEAKEGQKVVITGTGSDEITWQALRFGIEEGTVVQVEKNIPGGPVIISKSHLEIAIGREIAQAIEVIAASAGVHAY
jgi:Fe2+ transport system protein FeoA